MWPPAAARATPTVLVDTTAPMVATPSPMSVHMNAVEAAAARGLVMTDVDADTKDNVGAHHIVMQTTMQMQM